MTSAVGPVGPDESPLGLDASQKELEVVVEAQGQAQVALLGIPGAVAPVVAYAARHPDRVSYLVLLGGWAATAHGLPPRFLVLSSRQLI